MNGVLACTLVLLIIVLLRYTKARGGEERNVEVQAASRYTLFIQTVLQSIRL